MQIERWKEPHCSVGKIRTKSNKESNVIFAFGFQLQILVFAPLPSALGKVKKVKALPLNLRLSFLSQEERTGKETWHKVPQIPPEQSTGIFPATPLGPMAQ